MQREVLVTAIFLTLFSSAIGLSGNKALKSGKKVNLISSYFTKDQDAVVLILTFQSDDTGTFIKKFKKASQLERVKLYVGPGSADKINLYGRLLKLKKGSSSKSSPVRIKMDNGILLSKPELLQLGYKAVFAPYSKITKGIVKKIANGSPPTNIDLILMGLVKVANELQILGLASQGNNCGTIGMVYDRHKSCIQVFDEKKSFDDARKTCQQLSVGPLRSDLVEIRDAAMNAFINTKILSTEDYWTGLRYDYSSKKIKYLNGLEGKNPYSNWKVKQPSPSHKGIKCIKMAASKNGKWATDDCKITRRFVCQRAASLVKDLSCDFESYCGFKYIHFKEKAYKNGNGHFIKTTNKAQYAKIQTPYVKLQTSCLTFWARLNKGNTTIDVIAKTGNGKYMASVNIKASKIWIERRIDILAPDNEFTRFEIAWDLKNSQRQMFDNLNHKPGACSKAPHALLNTTVE